MSAGQARLVSYRDDMIDAVRDAGTQTALAFDPAWRDRAAAAIEELAASGRAFTAEDVRHLAGEPDSPNALGAALLTASKSGVIEAVGFAKSTRISRHGAWLRTWRRRLPDRGRASVMERTCDVIGPVFPRDCPRWQGRRGREFHRGWAG